MATCSAGSSTYRANGLVEAFHGIPHVDINLRKVPDEFSINLEYFQAVIIWACVPLLACVCAFILMSVYYIIVCCCCCCRPKKSRSKSVKCCCAFFVSLVIIMCCGLLAASIYAEFKLNENVSLAVDQSDTVQGVLDDIVDTAGSFNINSSIEDIAQLRSVIDSSSGSNKAAALQAVDDVSTVLTTVDTMYVASIEDTAGSIELGATIDDVRRYETIRHWTVVGYLILVILVLLITSITLICCSTCCTVSFLVLVGVLTLLVWAITGVAVGGVMVTSDICSDPDTVVRNLTGSINNSGIVDYYITCNNSCSPFTMHLNDARSGIAMIESNIENVTLYVNSNNLSNQSLLSVNDSVNNISIIVTRLATDVTCSSDSGINEAYITALNRLCADGSLYSVILMALSSALALTMVLLMCCLTGYAGLLGSSLQEDYDDTMSEYNAARTQSWSGPRRASYSEEPYTGAYRVGTTLNNNQPPHYSDLGQPHPMRRNSGEYDHF